MKHLTVVLVLAAGIWVGGQAPGQTDGMPPGSAQPQPASAPATPQANPASTAPARPAEPDAFTRAMQLGYAYAARGDLQTALINFRRALALRPTNPLAQEAVRNMEFYIAEQREAVRRGEIAALQSRLNTAVAQRDWACAAATVDQLTTYFPADSLDRARLVAYRGELTGFLNERTDIETWSTVCPGV
ncbi:MAG TPA: hypothetical protein V6D06_05325 [Trichocoleus sp.]